MAAILVLLIFFIFVGAIGFAAYRLYRAGRIRLALVMAGIGGVVLLVFTTALLVALLYPGARPVVTSLIKAGAWIVWTILTAAGLWLWDQPRWFVRVWLGVVLASVYAYNLAGSAASGPLMGLMVGAFFLPILVIGWICALRATGGWPQVAVFLVGLAIILPMGQMMIHDTGAAYHALVGSPEPATAPYQSPVAPPRPPAPTPRVRTSAVPHSASAPTSMPAIVPSPRATPAPGVRSSASPDENGVIRETPDP